MRGIYLLTLEISKNVDVKIGALGKIHFQRGKYIYIGSAQNGIEQRVERHKSSEKKLFWHIDYLLDNESVKIVDVTKKKGPKDLECGTAGRLSKVGEPIKDFGCSDCKCDSHLYRISNDLDPSSLF